jgi:hypothetical protein
VKDYPSMTAEDKKWKAECDAHALIEAEGITKDEARLKAAKEAAQKIHEEKESEAEAAKKVAKGQYAYPSMQQDDKK